MRHIKTDKFSPAYLSRGARPIISSAPTTASYNSIIALQLDPSSKILPARVTLIRYTSTTHSTNTDQRLLEPTILGSNQTHVVFKIPPNGNVAPPGTYHCFVLSFDGVPSVAKMMILGAGPVSSVDYVKSVVDSTGKTSSGDGSSATGSSKSAAVGNVGVSWNGWGSVLGSLFASLFWVWYLGSS
jgi:hypothetical protein